ncbi:hypothetical protein DCAR_0934278 [Daucus carota subsp. sativus]|uniref:Actin-fragmin kinase catalytic domain-containing protein n=1 Tax=Daucus carota subsp. sativus TaxID=79200 RepID=A0AAF0XVH4_DAUCS|nr:hypothetical protein DCAR_0934278 [Daucus carota subsp. sativus]
MQMPLPVILPTVECCNMYDDLCISSTSADRTGPKFSSVQLLVKSQSVKYVFPNTNLFIMATQSERLGYELLIVHNLSHEWLQIKEAAERVRDAANADGDKWRNDIYAHGSPLLESSIAFDLREGAAKIAAALGRILLLDLVIRNEDKLPCQQLSWRGNFANLLLADKIASVYVDEMNEPFESVINKYRPTIIKALQIELRTTSVDGRLSTHNAVLPNSTELALSDFHIVAVDSGLPRRPPAGKRANDWAKYPKLVELLINRKLGSSLENTDPVSGSHLTDMSSVAHHFQSGFRAAVRDLQGFHIFLLTLHQKLDSLLKIFVNIIDKTEVNKEDIDTWLPDPQLKLQAVFNKGNSESLRNMHFTSKLRDFHKLLIKDDVELNKGIEQWDEMLKVEAVKLCQENIFSTGFFESGESSNVIDAYELKVRLEHILERIALTSDAANTKKPSLISSTLFIGGALAESHILCLCSNEIGQSDSQHPDIFEYKSFSISSRMLLHATERSSLICSSLSAQIIFYNLFVLSCRETHFQQDNLFVLSCRMLKVCKTILHCLAVCSVCLSDKGIVFPSLLIVLLTWLKLGRQSEIVFPCPLLSCPSLDCLTLLVIVFASL